MKQETKIEKWGIKEWRKESWKWFSIYIRLKYCTFFGRLKCYTCEKVGYWKGDGFQAGHFQGGRGNAILLDEEQVRPQCEICNCWHSGEQYIFGKNLEKEYGVEKVGEFRKRKSKSEKLKKEHWIEKTIYYQSEAIKIASKKGLTI